MGFLRSLLSKDHIYNYYYYDTPEGKDVFKKMFFTTRHTTLIGIMGAVHEAVIFKPVSGFYPTLDVFIKWVGPLAAIGATYSAVTYSAFHLRKKDDYWNNFIGGACSGFVAGAARRHFGLGGCCAVIFGLAGVYWHVYDACGFGYSVVGRDKHGNEIREHMWFGPAFDDYTITADPKDRVKKQ